MMYAGLLHRAARNQGLTADSLGALFYLISIKPIDGEFSTQVLRDRFGFGRDKMQSVVKNLIQEGYVWRYAERNKLGQLSTVTKLAKV